MLREERDILRRATAFRQGDPMNAYPFIEAEKVTPAGNVGGTSDSPSSSSHWHPYWSRTAPQPQQGSGWLGTTPGPRADRCVPR